MATVKFTNENTDGDQSVELLPRQIDVIETAKRVDEGKANVSDIVTLLDKIGNPKADPLKFSLGMWPKKVEKSTLRQEVLKYLAPSSLDFLEKVALEMKKENIGADCRFVSDCWKEVENKIRREKEIFATFSSISF